MTTTEELLRETLHRHVHDAPLVTSYQPSQQPSRRFAVKWVAPIAVVAATAAVVGGVAWFDRQDNTSNVTPAAPSALEQVEGLTGPVVAEVLGLQGEPDKNADIVCATNVVVKDGVRYCFDGVTNDPAERLVIGSQLVGKPVTPSMLPYYRAWLELDAAMATKDSEDPSLFELQDRVRDLHLAMIEEQRALRREANQP